MILLRRSLPVLSLAASLLLASPAAFATVRTHRHASAHAMVRRTASTRSTHPSHVSDRLSYGMTSERASEIQGALIQRGYLSGDPTGSWDSVSIAAMQKLQSDNGWQTKFVPDSRAIIKLGLGPNSSPTGASTTSASTQTPQLPAAN